MKMTSILSAAIVLLAATCASFAGWTASARPEKPPEQSVVNIWYSEAPNEGLATLAGVFRKLANEGLIQRVKFVALYPYLRDPEFQKELFTALERKAPKTLHAALKSAGNMHNPKVTKLYKPFMESVLNTVEVKRIAVELAAYDLRITRASGEKFMLVNEMGQPRFRCGLMLEIEKVIKHGPAPKHG
jgi:hypothetical protein